MQIVMFTNHPAKTHDYFAPSHRNLIDGVLMIPGAEQSGLLQFPTQSLQNKSTGTPQDRVNLVRSTQGQVFLSHLEERMDWELNRLTGVEIYNIHADFKDECRFAEALRNPLTMLALLPLVQQYHQETFATLQNYPADYLRRWDELCLKSPHTGIAANDAHHNQGVRAFLDDEGKVQLEDALGQKLIALTFDVGEAGYEIAGYDGRIVDYLRENKIRATFFISGKWLLTHPKRAGQIIADPLIEVANHGWRHANLKALSGTPLADEINFAQAAYEEVRAGLAARACLPPGAALPERMTLLRFPYGTCNARALKAVAESGLLAIQWDLATGDPDRGQSARAIAVRVLKNVRPGSIILGHANGRGWNAAQALPLSVPQLISRGS